MYVEKLANNLEVPIKITFDLKRLLQTQKDYVQKVVALSLDKSKPSMGLMIDKGLFNSSEWWNNIDNGVIETFYSQGVIFETYKAGMDNTGVANSFRYKDNKGNICSESIYLLDNNDLHLFKENHLVIIYYAMLGYKDGETLDEVIEMAVSQEPI